MTHRHGWQQRAMSRNVSSLTISVLPGLMCCRTKSSGDPGGQIWTASALLVKQTLAGIGGARGPGASRDDEDKSREKSMAIQRVLRSLRWRERRGWKRFALGLAGKERKLAVPAGLYTWRTWLATEPAAIRLQLANAICQSGPEWGAQQTAGLLGWAHNRPRTAGHVQESAWVPRRRPTYTLRQPDSPGECT